MSGVSFAVGVGARRSARVETAVSAASRCRQAAAASVTAIAGRDRGSLTVTPRPGPTAALPTRLSDVPPAQLPTLALASDWGLRHGLTTLQKALKLQQSGPKSRFGNVFPDLVVEIFLLFAS